MAVVIRLCAACGKTSVSLTTGTTPLPMRLARGCPSFSSGRFSVSLASGASSLDWNYKLTGGVAVIHENLHLLEVLVAAQFSGAFDSPQISRRFGFTNPVLSARVIKADSGVSQEHSHASTSTAFQRLATGVFTPIPWALVQRPKIYGKLSGLVEGTARSHSAIARPRLVAREVIVAFSVLEQITYRSHALVMRCRRRKRSKGY